MATQYTAGLTTGEVLTAATMNSIGAAWETYTPTFVNITVGNGTVVARYSQVNKLVTVQMKFTLGSTSTIGGAGGCTMSLPKTSVSAQYDAAASLIGIGGMYDNAGTNYFGWVSWKSTSTVGFGSLLVNRYQEIYAPSPFTWGTGDILTASFTYEAA